MITDRGDCGHDEPA